MTGELHDGKVHDPADRQEAEEENNGLCQRSQVVNYPHRSSRFFHGAWQPQGNPSLAWCARYKYRVSCFPPLASFLRAVNIRKMTDARPHRLTVLLNMTLEIGDEHEELLRVINRRPASILAAAHPHF